MLDAEKDVAALTFQIEGQVADRRVGCRQGFAEVGEEGFVVGVFCDAEELTRLGRIFGLFRFWEQVVIQDAFGGFVVLFGLGFGARGAWSASGGFGVGLNMY